MQGGGKKREMDYISNYLFLLFPFFVPCQECTHTVGVISTAHAGLSIIRLGVHG